MATLKQKKAVKILLENPRKSVSSAMVEAGYSPATATVPGELTNSNGWNELLEQYLPDQKLLKVHTDALEATKIEKSYTEPDKEVTDHQTRLKAAELAYKLKRRMPRDGEGGDLHFHQHLESRKAEYFED